MKRPLFVCALIVCFISLRAQIRLDNAQSADFYVRNVLLGPNIQVGKVKHRGMIGGFGQFEAEPTILGVSSGLILSTGNIDSINGPNNSSGYTSFGQMPKSRALKRQVRKSDRDLNKICKRRAIDITALEFDFVPIKNKLEFNYVFASEEYPEYVGSRYNDVFGFFLSGPGIKRKINLAVLPDSVTPISINTVNHRKNKKYFRRNSGFYKRMAHKISSYYVKNYVKDPAKKDKHKNKLMRQLQFDGLTTVLKVKYDVIPYQKYRIKIAIADVSDWAFDSAVLLEAGSFVTVTDPTGQYYDTLKVLESLQINVDSILGIQDTPIDTAEELLIEQEFEITDIYFPTNSTNISDTAQQQLDLLAAYLIRNKSLSCTLWGFTDNTGSRRYNQKLSEKRAVVVRDYLIFKGIQPKRLAYQGHNFKNPKFDNASEQGRASNRRVEIIVEELSLLE